MSGIRSANENGSASGRREGGVGGPSLKSDEGAGGCNVLPASWLAESGTVVDAQLVKKASKRRLSIVALHRTVSCVAISRLSSTTVWGNDQTNRSGGTAIYRPILKLSILNIVVYTRPLYVSLVSVAEKLTLPHQRLPCIQSGAVETPWQMSKTWIESKVLALFVTPIQAGRGTPRILPPRSRSRS